MIDPDSPVVAYCAPGRKAYAERLIEGDRYRELIEHPWMEGRTDVILATDPNAWTAACYRAPAGVMIHGPGCTCETPP